MNQNSLTGIGGPGAGQQHETSVHHSLANHQQQTAHLISSGHHQVFFLKFAGSEEI